MDKYKIFKNEFSIPSLTYNELTVLYNLIGFIYLNFKKKNPDLTIEELVPKLTPKVPAIENYFNPVFSMHLKLMLEEQKFIPKTNIKDINEIKDTINKIMDNWLPF